MYNRLINVNMSQYSVSKAAKTLEKLRDGIKNINTDVIQRSLEWLRDKAIEELKRNYPERERRQKRDEIIAAFVIENNGSYGRLANEHEEVAYIEFGIGIIGENTHPIAKREGYEYNVPSDAKDNAFNKTGLNDAWFYKGLTQGNAASRFMFNAYTEFYEGEMYLRIYEEELYKALKG